MSPDERTPPIGPDETEADDAAPPRRTREHIGPYTIVGTLGEGGMGTVYVADQTEPIKRRVALKVIKHGMDSAQVIARFEAERQALALMDHPAIAKIYDAGRTPDGRPYFAMEYVKGVPITEHCDRERLTTRERLELFIQVCEGVQHAHQKAVIHRDLKPSNVLVSVVDGRPAVKIIDFGIAKAVAQRLTERTLYTELGVMIGTPEYMSPEQAEMTGQDVDTRSDVYSLGVMLYELLVGALPFEAKELRKAGFDEIRRKIREDEPPRPSARLSTLGDRSTESARRRRTEPKALRRELRGDLDWITMRALEKNRARRYGTPSEMAEDVRRHLGYKPVLAHSPSVGYRSWKFVRRHQLVLATAVRILVYGALALTFATVAWNNSTSVWGRRAWLSATARFEAEVGTLDGRAYRLPAIPFERNAATWIRAGSLAIVAPPDGFFLRASWNPSSWTDEEKVLLRRELTANADALAIVARAKGCSESNWEIVDVETGHSVRLGHESSADRERKTLFVVWDAVRRIHTRAQLALTEDRVDDAVSDVELLGTIARSLELEPARMAFGNSVGAEGLQLGVMHDLLSRPDTDKGTVDRLQHAIQESDRPGSYRRAFAYDSGTRARKIKNGTVGVGELGDTSLPAWMPVGGMREVGAARFLDLRSEMVAAIGRPYPEVKAILEGVRARARSGVARSIVNAEIDGWLGDVAGVSHVMSLRRLARLSTMLRLRALKDGRYPQSLVGIPGADGPDPLTGRELKYEVRSDGSAELRAPGTEETYRELGWQSIHATNVWALPSPRSRGGISAAGAVQANERR